MRRRDPSKSRTLSSMLIVSRGLRRRPFLRAIFVAVAICLLAASIGYIILIFVHAHDQFIPLDSVFQPIGYGLLLVVIFALALATGLLAFLDDSTAQRLVVEGEYVVPDVAQIRVQRKDLEDKLRQNDSPGVEWFDSLELNLNHLSEYYALNKSQSRNSFRMGVGAVMAGGVALLVGVALLYHDPRGISAGTFTSIGGVVIQFIGGSCFYLYNKSRVQIEFFYQKLNSLQGNMLAVRLCEQIEDPALRDQVRRDIVNKLVGSKPTRSDAKVKKRLPKASGNGAGSPSDLGAPHI
jgi:hypothetical protein